MTTKTMRYLSILIAPLAGLVILGIVLFPVQPAGAAQPLGIAAPLSGDDAGRGGDFLISTAEDYQMSADIAYNPDDDEYLIVWADQRDGATTYTDIYGQIYSAQGFPQGEPIPIETDVNDQDYPSVAYNTTDNEYLVAWQDKAASNNTLIAARRVTADGVPNATKLLYGVTTLYEHTMPVLVYDPNANHYLLVWWNSTDANIEGAILTPDGLAVGGLLMIANDGQYPKVAYNSHTFSYLVIYFSGGDIYSQPIAGDGSLAGAASIVVDDPPGLHSYELAFDSHDHEYLAVWTDTRNSAELDVFARRVGENGSSLGSVITIADAPEEQYYPVVVYNPNVNQYLVVWYDFRNSVASGGDIYGQRLKGDGSLAEQGNFAISNRPGVQQNPVAAFSTVSNQYLVVWEDGRASDYTYDLYGQRLHWLGIPISYEFIVTTALDVQEEPAIVFNSITREYLVAWADDRDADGEMDIWGQRYTDDGIPLGENIAIRVEPGNETHPRLAFDIHHNTYLIVWDDETEGDIEGYILASDGAPIGDAFNVSDGSDVRGYPDVAFGDNAEEYLVVFQLQIGGQWNIYGRRVSVDGSRPGKEFAITNAESDQLYPVVIYNPVEDEFLAAWSDTSNDAGDISARRVHPTETMWDKFAVSTAADAQSYPALAYNGADNEYLAAWHDYRNSGATAADVYGQRLGNTGSLLGGNFAISAASGDQQYPHISYIASNNRYSVLWQDNRNVPTGWDLYGQWVLADGSLAGFNLPFFSYSGWQTRPTGAYNTFLDQGFTVWQDGRNGAAYKIYGRQAVVDLEPPEAAFNYIPSVGDTNTVFVFNASPSYDNATPSGALIVRWDWESDGVYDTGLSLSKWMTHTYDTPGVYNITLEVRDLAWLTDTVIHAITVLTPTANTPPTATLTVSPSLILAGDELTFDATASTDVETPVSLQARWDWEDDGVWDTAFTGVLTSTHEYTVAGDYTIRVEVKDAGGLVGSASVNITVLPGGLVTMKTSPSAAMLVAGHSIQFGVVGWDIYGNEIGNPPVIWSVADPLAGTIDANGLFTATLTAGTYPDAILAQSGVVTCTTTVVVYWPYQVYLPVVVR